MALYAISNNQKMLKKLSEIVKTANAPKETRSGKEVANAVADKIGIKIDWGK